AVVISNPKDAQEAAMVGEKILSALKGSFAVNHHEVYIGASIGIALYPENGTDAASLTKAADTAMYCAKESGRNQYQFYSDDMQQRIKHQMQIANDLRVALDTDQLELYYQPQIDLKNGRLKRMEALLRWYHPERGMIGPSVFVPIAENTGLIHQLGEWAFLQAMAQMRKWLNEFGSQMRIPLSLNASPVQLKGGGFSNNFVALLKSQKLPPGVIDLELTETALMEQSGEAIEELAKIRAAGTKVLVDDFGTGYSSLSYLKQLSVDVLKVDSSFVRDIGKNTSDEAIVQAIINLAHNLGMTVAAEGVESHLQCDFIRRQGCDFAQGYYFNHPVEAGKATQLIARDLSLH
ncbi:MAG: bifunctional diguanylate cyclase/phosphodiesterase, partial [Exilibacterium sp.]